jgi:hypothetical protein
MGEGTAWRRCGGGCAGGAKSGGAKCCKCPCGSDCRTKSTLIGAGRIPCPKLSPPPLCHAPLARYAAMQGTSLCKARVSKQCKARVSKQGTCVEARRYARHVCRSKRRGKHKMVQPASQVQRRGASSGASSKGSRGRQPPHVCVYVCMCKRTATLGTDPWAELSTDARMPNGRGGCCMARAAAGGLESLLVSLLSTYRTGGPLSRRAGACGIKLAPCCIMFPACCAITLTPCCGIAPCCARCCTALVASTAASILLGLLIAAALAFLRASSTSFLALSCLSLASISCMSAQDTGVESAPCLHNKSCHMSRPTAAWLHNPRPPRLLSEDTSQSHNNRVLTPTRLPLISAG